MKKIFTLLIALTCSIAVFAQQEEQFTQFMYNKATLNSGYVGSLGGHALSGTFRKQWAGLAGSPLSQNLSFHTPVSNNKVGLGINLAYNSIGIDDKYSISGLYAYRIPIKGGTLGIGLNASVRYLFVNYTSDDLRSTTPISEDGSIAATDRGRYLPNFGLGLYYQNENSYVGISAPRLLSSNIDFSDAKLVLGKEVIHTYLMGGMQFPLSDNLIFYPQLLIKIAENSPFDADIHAGFIMNENIHLGATYRMGGDAASFGESIDLLVAFNLTNKITLGVSYDFTLSELRSYSNGTFEISMRYLVPQKSKDAKDSKDKENSVIPANPRFF